LSAHKALQLSRGHWAIENKLHWQLDVTFKEDQKRNRTGFSAENLSIVRKIVLNTIQLQEINSNKKKMSKKKII